jgi:hypothetical protein
MNMNPQLIVIWIGVVSTAAATEYCVLKRSYHRWSFLELICRGATVNGGVWALCFCTMARLLLGEEIQAVGLRWGMWAAVGVGSAIAFTIIGLIPAAIVATVYHRCQIPLVERESRE